MSDVRVFKVENRLAKVMRLPGGRTVAEAVTGAFGMKEAAEAAYSLCDLVDDSPERDAINWPAVKVHVDGVRFLCSEAGAVDSPVRVAIITGLREVAARFAAET